MANYSSNTGINMGLGLIGGADVVFKRKYRWTFTIQPYCGSAIPSAFVKIAARPNFTVEDTEINYLHGKMWIPGKASWETMTVTYYDVGGSGTNGGGNALVNGLFSWLTTVYNFADPVGLAQSSKIGNGAGSGGYSADGELNLYDGCGTVMESWLLQNMWPSAVNFGELDYSSSEEATIELTLRYAQVTFTPGCGGSFKPCCAGCSGS